MPKLKKYVFWHCKECEIDFIVSEKVKHTTHCPSCGDKLFTEAIKPIWLERPFNYKRKWTEEEDSIILSGRKLGKTYEEIAEELDGRTVKATTNRMYLIMKKMRDRQYPVVESPESSWF